MTRILITGTHGLIGTVVAHSLVMRVYEVSRIDHWLPKAHPHPSHFVTDRATRLSSSRPLPIAAGQSHGRPCGRLDCLTGEEAL